MIVRALIFLTVCMSSVTSVKAQELPVIAFRDFLFVDGISESARERFDRAVLAENLERAVRDSRKFRVVSRNQEKLDILLEEQEFSQSELSSGNAAGGGQLLATNFVVIPTITSYELYRLHRDVPNINGKHFRSDHGKLAVSLEILDTTTGESRGIYDFSDKFNTKEEIVNGKEGVPASSWLASMSQNIAGSFVNRLIATVFPMKVIAVQGHQVFINRGDDGGLREGETLVVFRPGMTLRDPDTGAVLGSTEEQAGRVKILDIKPKFTVATVIEGNIEELDILRKP